MTALTNTIRLFLGYVDACEDDPDNEMDPDLIRLYADYIRTALDSSGPSPEDS